jgi:hypothetical protein
MNYAKLRTETGVKFSGPLKEPEDFRRAIKMLTEELDIITSKVPQRTPQTVKKPVRKARENADMTEFLEGTNEH